MIKSYKYISMFNNGLSQRQIKYGAKGAFIFTMMLLFIASQGPNYNDTDNTRVTRAFGIGGWVMFSLGVLYSSYEYRDSAIEKISAASTSFASLFKSLAKNYWSSITEKAQDCSTSPSPEDKALFVDPSIPPLSATAPTIQVIDENSQINTKDNSPTPADHSKKYTENQVTPPETNAACYKSTPPNYNQFSPYSAQSASSLALIP